MIDDEDESFSALQPTDYWPDDDGDLRGDAASPPTATATATANGPPPGFVNNPDDCDDTCDTCWTGHSEQCDGKDNDCAGGPDD